MRMLVRLPEVFNIKTVLNKHITDFLLCLAFINSVSANGYQIVVSTSKPVLQQNVAVSTIQVSYIYII